MKVVFFGTPEFAAQFLQGLLEETAFEVVCVVTQPDEPVGRKKILTPPPVKVLAATAGITVLQPTKLKDATFLQTLENLQAEVGVVVAYGRILPAPVLNLFPLGLLNVHPSLLPKYRGPSPMVAALAAGDNETGISVIKLSKDMDAGPIMAQVHLPLAPDDTQTSLTQKVTAAGVPLLIQTLKDYAHGSLTMREQDHSQATFCHLLTRADGELRWSEPADTIERFVRAYNPWPGTASAGLKIFKVHITDVVLPPGEQRFENGRFLIGTGTQALEVLELQAAGGKRMSAADYLRGKRQ